MAGTTTNNNRQIAGEGGGLQDFSTARLVWIHQQDPRRATISDFSWSYALLGSTPRSR